MQLDLKFVNDVNEVGFLKITGSWMIFSFYPNSQDPVDLYKAALKRDSFHYILSFKIVDLARNRIIYNDNAEMSLTAKELKQFSDDSAYNLFINFKQAINWELFNSFLHCREVMPYLNRYISEHSYLELVKDAEIYFEHLIVLENEIQKKEVPMSFEEKNKISEIEDPLAGKSSFALEHEFQAYEEDLTLSLKKIGSKLTQATTTLSVLKVLQSGSSITILKNDPLQISGGEHELLDIKMQSLDLSLERAKQHAHKMISIQSEIQAYLNDTMDSSIEQENVNKEEQSVALFNIQQSQEETFTLTLLKLNMQSKQKNIFFAKEAEHCIIQECMNDQSHPEKDYFKQVLNESHIKTLIPQVEKLFDTPIELQDEAIVVAMSDEQTRFKNLRVPLWTLPPSENAACNELAEPTNSGYITSVVNGMYNAGKYLGSFVMTTDQKSSHENASTVMNTRTISK